MIEIQKGIFKTEEDSDVILIKLDKEYFEKEPIMAALHEYSHHYYTSMDSVDNRYVLISFTPKEDIQLDMDFMKNFSNRVIDFQIRRDLDKESGKIRDIITEYAYSPLKKKSHLEFKLTKEYSFLPFSFKRYTSSEILIINFAGEHLFVNIQDFDHLISFNLNSDSNIYKTLLSKHIIYNSIKGLETSINLLANQIRTKQRYLNDFTSLHMIEITNYCNLKCDYCHASTVSMEEKDLKKNAELKRDIIDKTIDLIFQSPSHNIKIELQGGEPLVNWETCMYLIENSHKESLKHLDKNMEIILCTNLILIDLDKLEFLKKYNVIISTSLDGTQELHDMHRTNHSNKPTYEKFIENLKLTRSVLGHESVGALLTVTSSNLYRLKEVVDEYMRLGFNGLFIRALNPYGMATKNLDQLGYPVEEFIEEYKRILEYIIEINLKGYSFIDYYSSLLMSRILTPFSTGFMDLQSPAGAGISGVIYDFNGDIYPTDEARMLARMGDDNFKIGNVLINSYEDIFGNEKLINITKKSILLTTPQCSTCIYNTYCGSDPIRNYVECGDVAGYKPDSEFCKKNMLLFDHIFTLIHENDSNKMNVFWSWISKKQLKDVRV